MSLNTLNEKYGLALDAVLIAGIVAGIGLVSIPVVSTFGAVAGIVGAVQLGLVMAETRAA
jgi:hypothetical protein